MNAAKGRRPSKRTPDAFGCALTLLFLAKVPSRIRCVESVSTGGMKPRLGSVLPISYPIADDEDDWDVNIETRSLNSEYEEASSIDSDYSILDSTNPYTPPPQPASPPPEVVSPPQPPPPPKPDLDSRPNSPQVIQTPNVNDPSSPITTNQNVSISIQEAFRTMLPQTTWPLPKSSRTEISSTFGPVSPLPNFHRGVDIHGKIGDPVLASYDGVVDQITTYKTSGLSVIIKHQFPTDTYFHPEKNITRDWYSIYMQLNDTAANLTIGDNVSSGDVIGFVGMSGSATTPTLHHEVRVGTKCSLGYALDKPDSTCNTYLYDPHVHPMLVYKAYGNCSDSSLLPSPPTFTKSGLTPFDSPPTIAFVSDVTPTAHGIFKVSTPDCRPNINSYLIEQLDSNGILRNSHLLDLNLRHGYDATSYQNLREPDINYPYLCPSPFDFYDRTWNMKVIIPWEWVGQHDVNDIFVVTVTDVWGVETSMGFTSPEGAEASVLPELEPTEQHESIEICMPPRTSSPTTAPTTEAPPTLAPTSSPTESVERVFVSYEFSVLREPNITDKELEYLATKSVWQSLSQSLMADAVGEHITSFVDDHNIRVLDVYSTVVKDGSTYCEEYVTGKPCGVIIVSVARVLHDINISSGRVRWAFFMYGQTIVTDRLPFEFVARGGDNTEIEYLGLQSASANIIFRLEGITSLPGPKEIKILEETVMDSLNADLNSRESPIEVVFVEVTNIVLVDNISLETNKTNETESNIFAGVNGNQPIDSNPDVVNTAREINGNDRNRRLRSGADFEMQVNAIGKNFRGADGGTCGYSCPALEELVSDSLDASGGNGVLQQLKTRSTGYYNDVKSAGSRPATRGQENTKPVTNGPVPHGEPTESPPGTSSAQNESQTPSSGDGIPVTAIAMMISGAIFVLASTIILFTRAMRPKPPKPNDDEDEDEMSSVPLHDDIVDSEAQTGYPET